MGMIRLLDENTINKIAAGEVIERPASIIKELVENSIDAGANLITIEIENGGIKKIRVMDNGCGMAPDDLSLAFERHSTSKISDFTDLNDLNSLGFRGEALSSIAAVSMATLKTKRSIDEMGAQIEVSGGKAGDVKPCGLSAGTSIIVENLFYNTPARFKFLKSVAAEAAAITDLVSKLILSHPDISFNYINNGATVLHSSGNGDIMNAASCVFGRDILDNVFSLEYVLNGIHVFGYCGYPQFSQKSRRYQSVFVNRRFIKSQLIASSVQNAYSERLLKGLFPFVLLYLDMPANYFDVNVHPNKLSVKFRDEKSVENTVYSAVLNGINSINIFGSVKKLASKPDGNEKRDIKVFSETVGEEEAKEDKEIPAVSYNSNLKAIIPDLKPVSSLNKNTKQIAMSDEDALIDALEFYKGKDETDLEQPFTETEKKEPVLLNPPVDKVQEKQDMFLSYEIKGQVFDSYIMVESGDDLLIIDSHAAHERLLYDKTLVELKNKAVHSQPLLMPHIVRVTHEEKNIINDNLEAFSSLGFDISDFGALEYRVSAVPYIYENDNLSAMFSDILSALKDLGHKDMVLKRDRMLQLVCKSAIKAGHKLSEKEIGTLVKMYADSKKIPTCPHGRPIVTVIRKNELEKSFKRIV